MMNEYYPFENLPLPYAYDAMNPYIDTKTMELHHDKHLQTYIDNLNKVIEQNPQLKKYSIEQMLYNVARLPMKVQIAVRNNAGGVYNHRMYFEQLTNPGIDKPTGKLGTAIEKEYEGFENFKEEFKKAALAVFGSGYAWLICDRDGNVQIITTVNQDNPLEKHLYPLLNIDVWEHAYYLKHYNVRAEYIDDWFMVNNWRNIEMRYDRFTEML